MTIEVRSIQKISTPSDLMDHCLSLANIELSFANILKPTYFMINNRVRLFDRHNRFRLSVSSIGATSSPSSAQYEYCYCKHWSGLKQVSAQQEIPKVFKLTVVFRYYLHQMGARSTGDPRRRGATWDVVDLWLRSLITSLL